MPHINDTAATILANAAARPDLKVFPLPESLRVNTATANKVLNTLVETGLLAGVGATHDDVAWAEDEEGGRTRLVVTPSGLRAINIEPEEAVAKPAAKTKAAKMPPNKTKSSATDPKPLAASAAAKTPATKTKAARPTKATATKKSTTKTSKNPATRPHKRPTTAKTGKGETKVAKKGASPRTGLTKQQIVVGMLRRADGASIAELAKATAWQPHSVRGVLTATIKNRLNLPLISEKGEDGVRRYYVAPIRAGKGKE